MNAVARPLLRWHARHGRHDLPWQQPRTPYRVWLSEVMLQQTQVATVIPYFERFVAALPDLPALAAADSDQVFALWSGLGYYRRARFLHAAARLCGERHHGELPRDFDALTALPGIGRSTAGAILAQAWDLPFAILDGNVKRVLTRLHGVRGWPGDVAVGRELWALAERHTPRRHAGDYAQAIMDLGATVCLPRAPRCDDCPLAAQCVAQRENLTAQLPQARAAKVLPQRHAVLLLLRDRSGRILLERRDGAGVWSGLWSLPHADDADAARALAARHAVIDAAREQALAPFRHSFSHYHLQASPLLLDGAEPHRGVAEAPTLRWALPQHALAFGLPAPVRRLLIQLSENPA
ncbi:MAG TPA: A/G-specific adenine glycosylase [Rhodanobacteraceae bacterium]|nr:A/G-specific adenine glycosylase [Rhodanobacteraceae bacterium]